MLHGSAQAHKRVSGVEKHRLKREQLWLPGVHIELHTLACTFKLPTWVLNLPGKARCMAAFEWDGFAAKATITYPSHIAPSFRHSLKTLPLWQCFNTSFPSLCNSSQNKKSMYSRMFTRDACKLAIGWEKRQLQEGMGVPSSLKNPFFFSTLCPQKQGGTCLEP